MRLKERLMKKIIGVATIVILLCGSAVAGDYWHFGLGVRGAGIFTDKEFGNGFGTGIIASLGDPDSRFTTHFEVDIWEISYTYDGSDSTLYYQNADDVTIGYEHVYSGLGAGFYEKVKLFNFTSGFSTYIIGGIGGYFLELQHEEDIELIGIEMRSQYLHSLFMMAGGLGFDTKITNHLASFIEGRYVYINSDFDMDKPIMKGIFGLKYNF